MSWDDTKQDDCGQPICKLRASEWNAMVAYLKASAGSTTWLGLTDTPGAFDNGKIVKSGAVALSFGMLESDIFKKDGSVAMTGNLNVNEHRINNVSYFRTNPSNETLCIQTSGGGCLFYIGQTKIEAVVDFVPFYHQTLKCGSETRKWSDVYAVNAHFDNYNLAAGDIPSLAASKITSETFALARIPTGIQGKLTAACSYLYSHPSARQCSTGNWAWASITGKPGTYPPSSHTMLSHSDGIAGADLFKKDGTIAMTGNLNVNEHRINNVSYFRINPSNETLSIQSSGGGNRLIIGAENESAVDFIPFVNNSQKCGNTTRKWSDIWAVNTHWGDLGFTETTCPKCEKKFRLEDNIILKVIRFDEEDGGIMTIPIHAECANLPTKTFKKKYAVKEDYYEWDEDKGEPIKRTRNKTIKKLITKKKIKPGYKMDETTKKLWKLKKQDKKMVREKTALKAEATEEIEEEISEVVYEEKEFLI